jgi:SAM-dependent methyltransferase
MADSSVAPSCLGVVLNDIEQAMPKFAAWMYGSVRPYLGHRVLDAGAGLGTYTDLLLADGREVVALEYSPDFAAVLRERYEPAGVQVHQADLSDPGGLPEFEPVQSALCLNVLEHVKDDVQALRNIRERVLPGGTLAVLVPAYPWLFNTIDESVGHHRRYRYGQLRSRLRKTGWSIERIYRFNAAGVPGWFVAGALRRKTPGRDLVTLYDRLVPVFAASEKYVIRGLWGLSLIAICRNPA